MEITILIVMGILFAVLHLGHLAYSEWFLRRLKRERDAATLRHAIFTHDMQTMTVEGLLAKSCITFCPMCRDQLQQQLSILRETKPGAPATK